MPRFSPEFIDELKSRLRASDVVGRGVKLKRRGNTWWGLSPFTKEKTPSFTVNDERRSYHCFSSNNHGDIITFLQETQGLSFMEAVTRLAEEAGMELPAEDPRAADKAKERKGLVEACNAAAVFFSAMLTRREGGHAADYLKRRGVRPEQIDTFGIGYAPRGRSALKDYLINKGFDEKTLIDAGLIIKPDEDNGSGRGASFDRFRDRVMFPIRRGKDVIAFGGRALDPNARAKYLNSPETPIFHKGDVLYNYDSARAARAQAGAAGDKSARFIVCEGYMDVIALWGAGFTSAVAPLGTALTEGQIRLLWRSDDEPLLCLDGDKAGIAAAHRSVDRALPMLTPGKSLSFVFLPDGKDPDDVIGEGGASAFADLCDGATPLVDVLWRREEQANPLTTPERHAAFRARLRDFVRQIEDKDVRNAYAVEIVRRFRDQQSPPQESGGRSRSGEAPALRPGAGWKRYRSEHDQMLVQSRPSRQLGDAAARMRYAREATIVLCALRRPDLIVAEEDAFFSLVLENADIDALMSELIGLVISDPGLDSARVNGHLENSPGSETLKRLKNDDVLNRQSFLRPGAELAEVEKGWRDALRHHIYTTAASKELSESAAQVFVDGDDGWKAAASARRDLARVADQDGHGDGEMATSRDLQERLDRAMARFRQ